MRKEIKAIPSKQTYDWLLTKHYAKRIPQIKYAFGLFDEDKLIGVITYGIPPSPALCRGVCGDEHKKQVMELNRLCLLNNEKNEASFLIANSMKLLPKPLIVVSYADTSQTHTGYVYQATNFLYTGLSAKRKEWTVQGLEHKHSKTLSDGMTLEAIKEKYGDKFYYRQRSRKHRYIYFLGNKRERKILRNKLRYKITDYPKP